MQILLLGTDNSVTATVENMMASVDGWIITKFFSLSSIQQFKQKKSLFEVIIANLAGFNKTPVYVAQEIAHIFPTLPLLAMYSYKREFLIKPLLEAGATGYLHIDTCEKNLLHAVRKVKNGVVHIDIENT